MKRIACYIAFFAMFVAAFCICASAKIYEGRALDEAYIMGWENGVPPEDYDNEKAYESASYYDVQYQLNTTTGVLRIFCGETNPQKMLPYAKGEWIPWTKDAMRPYIRTVVIEEGILSVGMFSFYKCENLEEVYLPNSILRIDQASFYGCSKLKAIYYAGNRSEFNQYVDFQSEWNFYKDGGVEHKAIDKLVFGESVTVRFKNQDGEVFRVQKVGGFFVDDDFSITPPHFDGLRYVGKKKEIKGKFKENDNREYEFEYVCAHSYAQSEELQFCSRFCIYCGCCDPSYEEKHTWVVKKDVERGLMTARELDKTCAVCGVRRQESEQPLIWTVVAAASAFLIVAAVSVAIAVPVCRRRRIKKMTW